MGSHYIPVGKLKIDKSILDLACPAAGYGETPPPPAIYCPAQGYYDPSKPIPYTPDPNTPVVTPDDGEIVLIVCDALDAAVCFRTSTLSGQVNYSIYGENDTLLASDDVNSNATYFKQLPASGGITLTNGYNAFVIKITAVTTELRTFRCYTYSGYGSYGWPIIEAHFKCPTLTSLADAFSGQKMLLYIKFYGNHNNLTSLKNFALSASNLIEADLGDQMDNLVSMHATFSACNALESINFPSSLDNLTTLERAFLSTNITNQGNMPLNMPSLNSMYSTYDNCVRLSGTLYIPNAPNLQTIVYLCRKAKIKKVIALSGYAMNVVTAWLSFDGCEYLEEVDFSAGNWGQWDTKWLYIPFAGTMPNLKIIKSPPELININDDLSRMSSLGSSNALIERTATIVTSENNNTVNMNINGGPLLENIYLPTLRTSSISCSGKSTRQYALKSIEIDWINSIGNINFRYTSLPVEEINRIFTALPSTITARSIDVRNTPGYATCDKTIAQNKGWTVS